MPRAGNLEFQVKFAIAPFVEAMRALAVEYRRLADQHDQAADDLESRFPHGAVTTGEADDE